MPADDRPAEAHHHSIQFVCTTIWTIIAGPTAAQWRSFGVRVNSEIRQACNNTGWLTDWVTTQYTTAEGIVVLFAKFWMWIEFDGWERGRGSHWRYSEEGRIWSVLVFSSRFACLRHKGNVSIKLINLVRIHTYVCISSGRKLINSVINLATNWRPVGTERSTSWSFMWLRWDIFYWRRLRRIVIIFESLQHILKKTFHYGKFNRQVLTTTHCGTRIWH